MSNYMNDGPLDPPNTQCGWHPEYERDHCPECALIRDMEEGAAYERWKDDQFDDMAQVEPEFGDGPDDE